MSYGSDARCKVLTSPTLQTGSLRLVEVILKDIGPCICTVQEESFLTDWNDFFYNDAKVKIFDEMGKYFTQIILFQWLRGGIPGVFLGRVCNGGAWSVRRGLSRRPGNN